MHLRKGLASLILLIVIVSVWGCVTDPGRLNPRFRATGYNGHFTENPAEPFDDYIKITRSNISAARKKAHVDDTPQIIDENAPVALFPDTAVCQTTHGKFHKGILLIHGLFDSTYPMQQLGKFFQSKCFVVYVILLPGHGTVPGDLLHTTYNDWVAATHYGTVKLAEKVDKVYLGGFSLGGLLAVNEALYKPDAISGLYLFAPALKLGTPLSPLVPSLYWTSRVVKRLQWWSLEPDQATARYESIPVNPVYQIRALMQIVRDKLQHQTLQQPLFIEESAQDQTVDTQTLLAFFQSNKNPSSVLLWYDEHSSYAPTNDRRLLPIHSSIPAENILSMSHLSFTLAPDDRIYGKNGEYKDCLNYKTQSPDWEICENGGPTLFYGELTNADLKTHIIRRISYNPFYQTFTSSMTKFIGAT